MCLVEKAFSMPSIDMGLGHGSAYGTIEDSIVQYVVDAYRGIPDRALTAGSISRQITKAVGMSGFYLRPEQVVEWVAVFEERTGRKILEEERGTYPSRYRCVYHKDIRIP